MQFSHRIDVFRRRVEYKNQINQDSFVNDSAKSLLKTFSTEMKVSFFFFFFYNLHIFLFQKYGRVTKIVHLQKQ